MSEELLQEHKTLLFFDFALTSSEALYNILEFVALTAGKPEDALESFNAMVRKQLAPRVVSGLGGEHAAASIHRVSAQHASTSECFA